MIVMTLPHIGQKEDLLHEKMYVHKLVLISVTIKELHKMCYNLKNACLFFLFVYMSIFKNQLQIMCDQIQ